jgi:hypothetical protein
MEIGVKRWGGVSFPLALIPFYLGSVHAFILPHYTRCTGFTSNHKIRLKIFNAILKIKPPKKKNYLFSLAAHQN